jgi:phenylacetate-coenzyme A ligase PaaK-like adenylate-forming protein
MITDQFLATNPFEFSNTNQELFFDSLRETAKIHYENNSFIKFLWDKNNYHWEDISIENDLSEMPFTVVNIFKNYDMYTGDKKNIELTLGSSGTGGQRSQIHLDNLSLNRVKTLAYNVHESLGITSNKKYNYLCFTYDPNIANDLGTAFTDELLTSFTDKAEVYYTFQFQDNDFYYNEEGTVEKLKQFANSDLPTRILGFPAFLYKLIKKHNLNLTLGDDSWVQTGGGWKGLAEEEIPKDQFRVEVSKALGLPEENIRDLFGMVEHGIPYVDCPKGRLRVPNYSRVIIRDPKSLKPLNYGEKGLIQFICSYNTSYPAISLLTTDWGVLKKHNDSFGDELIILGRAGVTKNKGCAIKAAQMLK